MPFAETKCCTKCNTEKLLADFCKNKESKDGLMSSCAQCNREKIRLWCINNLEKSKKTKREWWQRNKTNYHRKTRLKSMYGMQLEDYDLMFKKQDGKCAICETSKLPADGHFRIDHNHTTGKVRGLLCDTCNAGIGMLKEDTQIFLNAIKYLNIHKELTE